jgi:predicted outer membrane repeat protein
VGDNSLHVVYADGAGGTPITGTTVLDGFSITGGQADSSFPDNLGGGFFCAGSGSGSECSPSLINVTFSGNSAANYGGAIYNYGSNNGISSPSLSDVTFSGNSAGLYGGAIYNDGAHGVSSPSLMNVTFSGNKAVVRGGAIYNYGSNNGISSPSLVDVTFSANSAGAYGGAIYNFGQQGDSSPSLVNVTFSGNSGGGYGGAIYNLGFMGASNPSLVNVTFSGNSAIYGGAIYNDGQQGASSPSLVNVTFSGNSAVIRGGAIFNYGYSSGNSSPSLVNVILWNNFASSGGAEMYNFEASPTITASLVRGGITGAWVGNSVGSSVTDGGGNIDGDPLFARDPDPGDDSWTTLADNDYGDLRLTYGSPAIDAGTNLPALPPTDLDGNPRIINGVVDMGAYESLLEVFLPLVMK